MASGFKTQGAVRPARTNGSAQFDRAQIEKVLSSLGSRVFLLNNTHEDHPEIFQTRWDLCYLAGPLVRDQIKKLMDPVKASTPVAPAAVPAAVPAASYAAAAQPVPVAAPVPVPTSVKSAGPASLPPEIASFYVPCRGSSAFEAPAAEILINGKKKRRARLSQPRRRCHPLRQPRQRHRAAAGVLTRRAATAGGVPSQRRLPARRAVLA